MIIYVSASEEPNPSDIAHLNNFPTPFPAHICPAPICQLELPRPSPIHPQVVMYHMFESYNEIGTSNIEVIDIVSGVASFFVVALGGTIIGRIN